MSFVESTLAIEVRAESDEQAETANLIRSAMWADDNSFKQMLKNLRGK